MKANARSKTKVEQTSIVDRLIDVAEQLFGAHGIDGVSLRQISGAAGTGNNYAVQYHFGDLAGLIRAISENRMPEIERIRASYLAKAKQEKCVDDTRALMEALYRPLVDYKNKRGERVFAHFFLAVLNSPVTLDASTDLLDNLPVAAHILDLIAALNPAIPPALLMERQRLISIMVLNSIFNRRAPWAGEEADAALIENVIDMATAALLAPVSKPVMHLATLA